MADPDERGISAEDFKAGMALRAGAVAVVTSRAGDDIHGMTMTDWAGVSAEPPLMLVCCDKTSNTNQVVDKGRCFAVNLLRRDQDALSNKFASKKQEWERFDGLETEAGPTGAPLLVDCLASFDCRVEAAHDAGDHWVYVGRVLRLEIRDAKADPLVYHSGGYHGLGG